MKGKDIKKLSFGMITSLRVERKKFWSVGNINNLSKGKKPQNFRQDTFCVSWELYILAMTRDNFNSWTAVREWFIFEMGKYCERKYYSIRYVSFCNWGYKEKESRRQKRKRFRWDFAHCILKLKSYTWEIRWDTAASSFSVKHLRFMFRKRLTWFLKSKRVKYP